MFFVRAKAEAAGRFPTVASFNGRISKKEIKGTNADEKDQRSKTELEGGCEMPLRVSATS